MKILVCIKQISLILARTGDNPNQQFVSQDDRVQVINPIDLIAVEAALRLKKDFGAEILLVTLGSLIAEERLRRCWAMGADRLLNIEVKDCDNLDSHQKAVVLASVLERESPDLILCGQMSLDTEGQQLGARLAVILDMPYVSRAVFMDMVKDGNAMNLTRGLERGDREMVHCELPAVFSVQTGVYQWRYPLLKHLLWAKKQPIEKIQVSLGEGRPLAEKAVRLQDCLGYSLPKPRPRNIFSPDRKNKAASRIKQLMSGGGQKKEGTVHAGQPAELCEKIMDFFSKNGLLKGNF